VRIESHAPVGVVHDDRVSRLQVEAEAARAHAEQEAEDVAARLLKIRHHAAALAAAGAAVEAHE
jgi:hypothetical protein